MVASASGQGLSDRRWSVYQRLQGSTNTIGQILKLDTGISADLGRGVSLGGGLPVYFVRDTSGTTASSLKAGIGNAYVGLGYTASDTRIGYSTYLQVSAPTGNKEDGFSTGDVTVDWSNTFSVPVRRWTPFATVGLANTVSDTSFFTRPFSSIGLVTHLQGGAVWTPGRRLSLGGSGYAVVPTGDQTVVSRVRRSLTPSSPGTPQLPGPGTPPGGGGPPFPTPGPGGDVTAEATTSLETTTEVTGDADLARDNGFSAWITIYPPGGTDFYMGYSRSVRYDLDSLFLGFGWRFNVF